MNDMFLYRLGQKRGGGSGGGGGAKGFLRVIKDVVVPASSTSAVGSVNANHVGPVKGEAGYIPGTPISYVCHNFSSNSGMSSMTYYNASASDYTLESGIYEPIVTYGP